MVLCTFFFTVRANTQILNLRFRCFNVLTANNYRQVNASTGFLKTILSLCLAIFTGRKAFLRIINHHRLEVYWMREKLNWPWSVLACVVLKIVLSACGFYLFSRKFMQSVNDRSC
jgi:hypothetical protein